MKCWNEDRQVYQHKCQLPSGKPCYERDCNEPAGTWWGPHWCPEHDVARMVKISDQFEALLNDLERKAVR